MRITLLTFGTAILFAAGSLITVGSASAQPEHAEEKGDHEQGESKRGEGEHEEHEEGGESGVHMQRMHEVLQSLKQDLGDKYDQPVPAATEKQLALGETLYTKSCAVCHGESGKGDGPAAVALDPKPSNFTDTEHSKVYSDEGRIHIIKKGLKDSPMVGWESILSENDILSVHAYIRSLRSSENEEKAGHGEHEH